MEAKTAQQDRDRLLHGPADEHYVYDMVNEEDTRNTNEGKVNGWDNMTQI